MPLPAAFTQRLEQLLAGQAQTVLHSLSQPRVTSFRVNTLKASISEVRTNLATAGYQVQGVPWWPAAFYLPDLSVRKLFHSDYQEGKLYVQGLASMLPPLVLQPQASDQVLDLTAAPGSKTTQLAALMANGGHILANDLSPVRLFKLQANLRLQGVTNTQVRRGPGELLWQKFPEQFDRTLVDVPCSMEGRIQLNDPESYQDWSLRKIKELSLRQRMLLRSAVSATKPGGVIVYSTCTLAPEENEAVVNWLLEKEEGRVVIEPVELDLAGTPSLLATSGLTVWQDQTFHSSLNQTLRIYPSQLFEGFFLAKLRKLSSTVSELPLPAPNRRSRAHRSRRQRR